MARSRDNAQHMTGEGSEEHATLPGSRADRGDGIRPEVSTESIQTLTMLDHVHGGFHLDMRRFTWCFPSARRLPNTSTFGLCVYCQAKRPWWIIAIISGTVVTLTRGRPCLAPQATSY